MASFSKIIDNPATIVAVASTIVDETVKYLKAHEKLETLVLGVSGGIDSALCAALARKVCDRLNGKVKLLGRIIPIKSKPEEMIRAVNIASCFCDDYKLVDFQPIYSAVLIDIETPRRHLGKSVRSEFERRVRNGNIKARLRMIQLFHTAHATNGMVLSTDNFTEYLLGFWTMHGDVGNFGMIQNLWKSEVYLMANSIDLIVEMDYNAVNAMNACMDAVPTDGLGITESDLDQFGSEVESYADVDRILYDYLRGEKFDTLPKIVNIYEGTHYKRNDPVNISRDVLTRGGNN